VDLLKSRVLQTVLARAIASSGTSAVITLSDMFWSKKKPPDKCRAAKMKKARAVASPIDGDGGGFVLHGCCSNSGRKKTAVIAQSGLICGAAFP